MHYTQCKSGNLKIRVIILEYYFLSSQYCLKETTLQNVKTIQNETIKYVCFMLQEHAI